MPAGPAVVARALPYKVISIWKFDNWEISKLTLNHWAFICKISYFPISQFRIFQFPVLFCIPMWSVCKKELRQFFSSLTGYIAIIVFLLVNGLVLFVFDDNIFDFGYATLDRFFQLAPWILLLLIPAITMRSFADEFKTGTYEILQTRPLSRWQIIGGKYFGSLIVVFIALLPTIIYIISIQRLSSNEGLIWAQLSDLILVCFFWRLFLRLSVFAAAVLPIMRWWLLSSV